MTDDPAGALHRLHGDGTEVVVDTRTGTPAILHWGAPLGDDADLDSLTAGLDRPLVAGALDVVAPISCVPEHGAGFPGHPGLSGHRGRGVDWSPRFAPSGIDRVDPGDQADGGSMLVVTSVDDVAGLRLTTTISLGVVLRVRVEVTNVADRRYSLDELCVTVPLPEHIAEIVTFEGRWSREFQPVRRPWSPGAHVAENRRGRTSHEAVPLVFGGSTGFGEWSGDVYGLHLAWSGNHVVRAEVLADGRRYVQLGELLHPGELVLEPGESYTTPEVVGVHSDRGLTPATWGFHRSLRSRPAHPTRPRPVLINTWEAVYFDHERGRLLELAETAAEVGVERFVLDDGWFGSRRDDTSGLGEWWVSSDAHPDGLGPLIDRVRALGMEFGIWVEPEMVSPNSSVYGEHPEWALTTDGYEPVEGRSQLLLDLARPEAYEYVLQRLDSLLADHDIAFVKWDMNREHVQASGASGAAGSHDQTLALYSLLDQLRERHPLVEIESCASGGGRVDHEILRRTERVWTSDCNDALERQQIHRGASMLIPPEAMGAHIGPPRAHTTGRRHSLAFRAATAMFGHLGVEWDITTLDPRELEGLRRVIALHKEHRALLHSGDVVRFDTTAPHIAHGVYAADRSEAIVSFAAVAAGSSSTSPPLRLPDLDAGTTYRVRALELPGARWGPARSHPAWLASRVDGRDTAGIRLTGAQLAHHGIRPPTLNPESAVLFHLAAC